MTTLTLIKAVRGNSLPIYQGVDYTGKQIGDWTVLGPITCKQADNHTKYVTKWLCQCTCGSAPAWVIKRNLVRGASQGCYACYGTRNSNIGNANWKGHGQISGEIFHKVRCGAKQRGIPLEISIDDLHNLWVSQNGKCALTGISLVLGETSSLDRIDSLKSYCIGNIQWVHKVINIMKNDFPEEVFLNMCHCVSEHHKQSI